LAAKTAVFQAELVEKRVVFISKHFLLFIDNVYLLKIAAIIIEYPFTRYASKLLQNRLKKEQSLNNFAIPKKL
jgi:hypothetical protein